jgi:DNA-binding XRE family transcriptional regulator
VNEKVKTGLIIGLIVINVITTNNNNLKISLREANDRNKELEILYRNIKAANGELEERNRITQDRLDRIAGYNRTAITAIEGSLRYSESIEQLIEELGRAIRYLEKATNLDRDN